MGSSLLPHTDALKQTESLDAALEVILQLNESLMPTFHIK